MLAGRAPGQGDGSHGVPDPSLNHPQTEEQAYQLSNFLSSPAGILGRGALGLANPMLGLFATGVSALAPSGMGPGYADMRGRGFSEPDISAMRQQEGARQEGESVPGPTGALGGVRQDAREMAAERADVEAAIAAASLAAEMQAQGTGDYGYSPSASQNDFGSGDPGFGSFKKGGPVPNRGRPALEPRRATVHEGEFVVRAEMAKRYRPILERINAGTFQTRKGMGMLRL